MQDTQRKDTNMVCIDGCNMTGKYPWDSPQPINDDSNASHGCSNCGMASLKMMASAGGCSLSQDRIAYYMMEEAGTASYHARLKNQIGNPWQDINHSPGGGLYSADCPLMVSWLYNQPASASKEVFYNDKTFYNDTPAMDSIAEFIADNRPVLRHRTTHTNLITGAGIINIPDIGEFYYIKVYDTNIMGNIAWLSIEATSAIFNEFTFPPTTGRMTRNDEPEIWEDSDSDGLVDFDEANRFHTDPNNEDTDGDRVKDKQDIIGYVFTLHGDYLPGARDFDHDGKPKELDPDNDDPNNSSAPDGCEDADLDGFVTPGSNETTCFNVNDDFTSLNPDCYKGIIKVEMDASQSGPDYSLDFRFAEILIIESGDFSGEAYVHPHTWTYDLEYYCDFGSAIAHDRDQGQARFELIYEPSTMEYFAKIDSTLGPIEVETTVTTPILQHIIIPPPTVHWFDNNELWPLGQAQPVNGGMMVKGEFVEVNFICSWEIWIEPPG